MGEESLAKGAKLAKQKLKKYETNFDPVSNLIDLVPPPRLCVSASPRESLFIRLDSSPRSNRRLYPIFPFRPLRAWRPLREVFLFIQRASMAAHHRA